MSSDKDLHYKHVIRTLTAISHAIMALHGRDLYNMFGLYAQELKRDMHHLFHRSYMGAELQPATEDGTVILPAMAAKSARRMRYMWDYFVFIYMSHKIQNLERRQLPSGPTDVLTILYLRGSDYQLAISRDGAAVGHTTMDDTWFDINFLSELKGRYNVVKALSPGDLQVAMANIGPFLAQHGNVLESVARFAIEYDGGVFLNTANWKERVVELFPSASLFLVYVSNQSNGLAYELERLVAGGLEANTILVLDKDRFGSRESFFMVQERLKEMGEELYVSVDRDGCAVEDPEAFERLVSCFPHRVELGEGRDILPEIEVLIPVARRDPAPPAELPFEFHITLDAAEDAWVAALRGRVDDFIEESLSRDTVTNWPVLLLHVEMDILLSLAFGDILKAAIATARYAAIAHFTREFVKGKLPGSFAGLEEALTQCATLGMNAAYHAFALGPWNDYSERHALSQERIGAAAGSVIELMWRSVERADKVAIQESRGEAPPADPSTYGDLMNSLLQSTKAPKTKSKKAPGTKPRKPPRRTR
jgi:hypothetical protein